MHAHGRPNTMRTPARVAASARSTWLLLAAIGLTSTADFASAEPPGSPTAGAWQFETVELHDDRTYQGFVREETADAIRFVHVERPPGAPIYAVVLSLSRAKIRRLVTLPLDQRAALQARLAEVLHRARVEALDTASIVLNSGQWHRQPTWEYVGSSFRLTSTADELTTRRAAVRLEQYFTAYSQWLPARAPGPPLRLFLHGSTDEYRRHLAQWGLDLNHAAVYVAERREILAAAELSRFSAELAATQAEHDRIQAQYEAIVAALPERLREESRRLKAQGARGADLREMNLVARKRIEAEAEQVRRQAAEYDRRNAELFAQVTAGLFATLGHEATHAWLDATQSVDNPAGSDADAGGSLPRWLNEGLAQLFETAQLDGGRLRIDAPDAVRLKRLQDELAGNGSLALAELLAADERLFLVAHADRGVSERHYAYSWGLTYYLAAERGLVTPAWLEAYAAQSVRGAAPVEVLERLVGEPLADFEVAWRTAMLALAPPTRVGPPPQSPPR